MSPPAKTAFALALALFVACAATPAGAQSAADFYRGRTITLYVGSTTGGAYDAYARVLARHMGAHMAGNPRMVVANMEGAGSLRLANYLYNAAPKDGTVLGTVNRSAPFEPLLGEAALAKFDAAKFTWIGSPSDEVSTCVVWKRTGIENFTQLLTMPLTVGGTGAGADTNQFPKVLNGVFGTKIKIVSGYPGGSDIDIAMERGEVDGRCGWSWSSVQQLGKKWLDDGSMKVVVQLALHKHPDLPDVPLVMDFAKTDEQRAVLRLIFARNALAYPFMAPPGIPADRAAALKEAFDETMKDGAFRAEALRANLEVAPVSGAELEKLIAELYRTPKDVVAKTRAIVR
jgi:tripartite-type tricarboxylate transporter receptor subunit TctC